MQLFPATAASACAATTGKACSSDDAATATAFVPDLDRRLAAISTMVGPSSLMKRLTTQSASLEAASRKAALSPAELADIIHVDPHSLLQVTRLTMVHTISLLLHNTQWNCILPTGIDIACFPSALPKEAITYSTLRDAGVDTTRLCKPAEGRTCTFDNFFHSIGWRVLDAAGDVCFNKDTLKPRSAAEITAEKTAADTLAADATKAGGGTRFRGLRLADRKRSEDGASMLAP